MATLEQIAEGIRRAHAAGNAEHVKALGAEYRRLQAEQKAPASGFARLMSGGDPAELERSANVTMAAPKAKNPLDSFNEFSNSVQSGFNQGLTLGFGDELFAGVTAPFAAVGPMMEGNGYDLGAAYGSQLDATRGAMGQAREANPIAAGVGEIAGGVINPITKLFGGPMAAATNPWAKAGIGAAGGAALGGLYGAGTADGDMGDRLAGAGSGALTGGLVGAAMPTVSKVAGDTLSRLFQRRATNSAIRGAPSASDLKAASSAMFQQVDNSGVTVDTNKFAQFVQDQVRWAKSNRINPNLDPKATGAFESLIQALDDVQKNGGALALSDMHTLRQIAQKAAVSSEGRDAMFASHIVEELDDFVTKPGVAVLPANRLGSSASAPNELLKAISTWGKARRVGLIEEAIYKAQNQASGLENGLRIQFRALLQNPRTRNLFTRAEREALEDVVRGNVVSNLTKLLGKFGFGPNNMLGGTIGASIGGTMMGGIPGALATAAVTSGARKVSEKLTEKAANRAARVIAAPNVPSLAPVNLPALPAAVSLPAIDYINR